LKSQRRHELKESELAKELSKAGVFFKEHLGTVVLSVLAVGAVIFLIITLIGNAARARQNERVQLHEAAFQAQADPRERLASLQQLAEQSGQDPVAAWAHVHAGELALRMVADDWYDLSDTERTARLAEAATAFETVIAQYGDQVRAVGKARLGLGRVAEYRGDREEAVAQYDAAAALADRGARLIAAEALARRTRLETLGDDVSLARRPATQPAATQPSEAATQPAS